MAVIWKEIALAEDLPAVFERNTDGLVPSPGTLVEPTKYCLNANGDWVRVRSEDNDINSFGGLTDAPDYNTNEVDKAVKYVRGIRISSLTHDSGTNTVTVYCTSQHGLSQSDSVTIVGCNVAAYNGSKSLTGIIGSQGTEFGDSIAFTFSSSDSTSVTIPGYITGTAVDDNMLVFADDAGISDHSIAFSKLPEINAMKVIGNITSGPGQSADAAEVSIDAYPTENSDNLVKSHGVFSYIDTFGGSANIDTVGDVGTGTWNGTAIADGKISSSATWNGKQDALTFGIAQNNTVKISSAVVDDSSGVIFPKFTATGLTARTSTDFKTDLSLAKADVGLSNVTNEAQLPLSGGTMTSHIEMDGNKLKFATDEFITGDGTNLNLESGGAINLVSVGGDTAILIGDADETSRFEVKLHAQGVSPMLAVTGEADAQSDFCIYEAGGSSADDLFRIRVSEHGQTAISTIDNAGADADMQIIADGQLLLSGVSGTKIAMSVLDDASDVDGAASGDIVYEPTSYSSGVTGVPGKCYYIKGNSNTWSESDASNSGTTSNLIAIATNANASKGLVLRGIVKLSHDVGGDPGDPVYLSETAAELTTTAPTTSGAFVRVVGYLISTVSSKSTIYFNPDNTYIEIA